jgi:molybdopterin synthase catalytic subunit
MIQLTTEIIQPDIIISETRTASSGCVATYVGLIRDMSHGKPVLAVEYTDPDGTAARKLAQLADEIRAKWPVNSISICHRIGRLKVGEINFMVAIGAVHRREGFAACRYAVDRFKKAMPTTKVETYSP